MLKTALLSASLAVAGYGCSAWLTHDFQVWTAEGARRLEVALQPIAAPSVQIDGPGLALGSVYQQMQTTLQAAGKTDVSARKVRLLSISFDGQHDNPQILQAYAARLSADPQLWHFVRVPDPKETQRLLAAFQVVVVPDGRGDFEHNAALLVVDQHGQLLRIFDYAEQQLALDYARDLASVVSPR